MLEIKVAISVSVAILGRRKLAFAKETFSSALNDLEEWMEPPKEVCFRRVAKELARCELMELRRPELRRATAVLDNGCIVAGVRGRDMDGGSEATESRIPAIFKRSAPRSLRRASTTPRYLES